VVLVQKLVNRRTAHTSGPGELLERHGLQIDGLKDEAGSMLGAGAGVGGVRALAAAAGGGSGFEAISEGGLEALDGCMEINAVEHPERGLHVAALILEAAEQGASFLRSQRRALKIQCNYARMQRKEKKRKE
jgi:hypothetical protein